MISQLWSKLVQAAQRPSAKFTLTHDARRVLTLAESRGYQVVETIRQGCPAILLEKEGGGSIHFWSSNDILEYGRNNGWI
jgi:hypothetical protein